MELKFLIDLMLFGSIVLFELVFLILDLNVFLYVFFGWYMTFMSVMDLFLSSSFILVTRWSVIFKNL